MANLIGNLPNQVPTNGDLGTMAFQDSSSVNITGGTVDVSAGTAALPTLGTTGDANTGVFFPAADTIAMATNGVERIRIDNNGTFLVGVISNGGGTPKVVVSTGALRVMDTSGAGGYRMDLSSTSTACTIAAMDSQPIIFGLGSGASEKVRISVSGGISIGNTVDKGAGSLNVTGLIYPQQATTALAPAYVKGAIYFDTTLNKLRVGGATAWETVTSI
jgi:hypothetical protein